MHHVVIINYGSQYTRNIKKRLREQGVEAAIYPPNASTEELDNPAGIILSGSPASIYDGSAPRLSETLARLIFAENIPTLGLCYGMDLIAEYAARGFYEAVKPGVCGEYGRDALEIAHAIGVLKDLKGYQQVWMSHGDQLILLPPGFERLDPIKNNTPVANPHYPYCPIKALMHNSKPVFGLQFHPEVPETLNGHKIFANFLEICGAKKNWGLEKEFGKIKAETIAKIGEKHVFAAISTGNDSGVMAYFLRQITPQDRLHFLYIRAVGPDQDDLEKIKLIGGPFDVVNARQEVFRALEDLIDPEEKRRAFSRVYREIIELWLAQKIAELSLKKEDCIIAQGTLWPDMVESRTEESGTQTDKIKSHHNIGVFEDLRKMGNLLEPFAYLFKDEVRRFGRQLGVPERIITQHPWPGPGYIVRFLGYDSESMPQNEQYTQAMLAEGELHKMCAESGYSVYVLPLRGTGVQGDARTYCYTAALIGPYKRRPLLELATAIPNKFKGKISRVVYVTDLRDMTSLSELGFKKDHFIAKTRKILEVANEKILIPRLRLANLYSHISQAFVVIAPLSFTGHGYTAVIRAVDTEDFMTCSPHWLPEPFLRQTAGEILARIPEIELVLYDLTSKPPGTIEWE